MVQNCAFIWCTLLFVNAAFRIAKNLASAEMIQGYFVFLCCWMTISGNLPPCNDFELSCCLPLISGTKRSKQFNWPRTNWQPVCLQWVGSWVAAFAGIICPDDWVCPMLPLLWWFFLRDTTTSNIWCEGMLPSLLWLTIMLIIFRKMWQRSRKSEP